MMAPRKLENIRFARGLHAINLSGMMGFEARDSMNRKAGKAVMDIIKDVIMNGCDPLCIGNVSNGRIRNRRSSLGFQKSLSSQDVERVAVLQGNILPPRFNPRMSVDTDKVSDRAPMVSNPRATWLRDSLSPTMPRSFGITTKAITIHKRSGGICTPNSHRHPIVSAMVPPTVAPKPEPMPTAMLIYDR